MILTSGQRPTPCRRYAGRYRTMPRGLLLLAALLGVARCAEPAATAVNTGRPGAASSAAAAPAGTVSPGAVPGRGAGPSSGAIPGRPENAGIVDGDGKPVLFNDPPASPDTPLCGRQAREANAIGAALQGPAVATAGICARFACYDPLTATYIGADGYRHVCR